MPRESPTPVCRKVRGFGPNERSLETSIKPAPRRNGTLSVRSLLPDCVVDGLRSQKANSGQ